MQNTQFHFQLRFPQFEVRPIQFGQKAEFGYRHPQQGVLLEVAYRGNPVPQMGTAGIAALWCQSWNLAATDHHSQRR